ncbi:MAG: lmo0937 family membrane protein [Gemmatimonadaceae bacterium]
MDSHTFFVSGVTRTPRRRKTMFLTIALVLLLLWALGFFVFPAVGALIHILLVLAIISILWHFIARPTTRV